MADQEIDVNKLVENIEKYGEADPKELQQEQVKEESPYLTFKTNDDFLKHQLEYKANEKPIKEDLATILKRASQGYNYAQHMAKLNSERQGFEGERKTWEQKYQEAQALQEKWSKFENYAKENPAWYDHWNTAWDSRGNFKGDSFEQSQTGNPDLIESRLNQLLSEKLKPYEQLITKQQEQEQLQKISQEDKELSDQVESIRKNYPDIDFDKTDPETGATLEYQVLKFMHENGMRNFQHAFKAFYHDNLIRREVERKKEAEQKAEIERKKQGIVDIKSAPSQKRSVDTKNMSWDEVLRQAQKELGVGN